MYMIGNRIYKTPMVWLSTGLLSLGQAAMARGEAQRPNILFFLVDDMGWQDTSLPVGTRKAGRKKRTGYVVDTYKVYKDADGNVAERQKLWTTTYRAMQDEILYNDGSGAAKE